MLRDDKRLLLIGNTLTLFLASMGLICGCMTAYGLAEYDIVLIPACVISTAAAIVLWAVPEKPWFGLGGIAVTALAALVMRSRLTIAAQALLLRIASLFEDKAGWAKKLMIGDNEVISSMTDRRILLIFFALTATLVLGALIVRLRSWLLVLGMLMVPVLPAFVAGVLPQWWTMLASLAAVLTLLFTGLYEKKSEVLGRGMVISLAISAAFLLFLTVVFPQATYTYPEWALDGHHKLRIALGLEQPVGDGEGKGGVGVSLSEDDTGAVDLKKVGPLRYNGHTVLRLTGETSGKIYLRGASAATYTGDEWVPLRSAVRDQLDVMLKATVEENETPLPTALYPAYGASEEPLHLYIEHTEHAAKLSYTPYQLMTIPANNLSAVGDTYLRLSGVDSYAVSYQDVQPVKYDIAVSHIPSTGDLLPEDYMPSGAIAASLNAYNSFVRTYYVSGSRSIEELVPLYEQLTAEDPVERAYEVARLLSTVAVYDEETPAMEEGDDFVTHFLREGRGYCVHFATTAALLLKMSDIPARYVSGYVGYLDQSGHASVLDSSAHAWVEIYLEDYGWYPVEVTPPEPEEESRAETPDEEEEIVRPAAPDPEKPKPEETPVEPEDQGVSPAVLLVLLPCAVFGPRFGAMLLRLWQRRRKDTNRSTAAACRYYHKLLEWGNVEDRELQALGDKAAFSQHTVTEAERRQAWILADRAQKRIRYSLPYWKLLLLRWVRLLA